jgi:hypothetical protein
LTCARCFEIFSPLILFVFLSPLEL